jgi:hypothetical protein
VQLEAARAGSNRYATSCGAQCGPFRRRTARIVLSRAVAEGAAGKIGLDFRFANHGSITILTALNVEAQEWIDTHIAQNNETRYWGGGIVIEPRCAGDILDGIFSGGLVVA